MQNDNIHGGHQGPPSAYPAYPPFPPQAAAPRSDNAGVVLGIVGTVVALFLGPVAVYATCIITREWFYTLSIGTFIHGLAGIILGILALTANKRQSGNFGGMTRGKILGIVSIVGGSIGFTLFLFFAMILVTMWAIK